jgi:phosphatidylethanolamine-binding protein (PEBP) family uncharacterized protein
MGLTHLRAIRRIIHFQFFALDTVLKLPSGFNRLALLDAMKGHVIARGELVGNYQRKDSPQSR